MSKLLVEMQYLGHISYYMELAKHPEILIEAHENFEKSTYRNRCYISSPNGILRLTIPVEGGKGQRALYSQLKIDYESDWQKNHWLGLCSCYRNSPYFEFYEDRFEPFYTNRFESLFDFNRQLMELVIELLGLELNVEYTQLYEKKYPEGVLDFRSISYQSMDNSPVKYRQVFEDRTGFIPNLSIVDLLFNEGPHSKELLLVN